MAYKTMQQLVVEVQKAIYQAAGTAVQVYSQDVLVQQLQQGFDHIFTKEWWPQYRVREVRTLDGVNGYATAPLSHIKSYEDIRYVFPGNGQRPLPAVPLGVNPVGMTGNRPRFVEGDANKIFRVWPKTATGDVVVVGRARPNEFLFTDVVPMDPTLLVHFAAWSYLSDDGSNPEATIKHKMLFEQRYAELVKSSFNEPIMLDPWMSAIPDEWTERRV